MRGARGTPLLLVGLLIAITLGLQGCPSLIANRPPNAEFTADPTQGEAPLTVQFDASASSDPDKDSPDGDIVGYEWDFGDGETATGAQVEHTYDDDGTFTATLTVTDGQGATDTASIEIEVSIPGPTASFTFTPQNPRVGETVTFDASDSVDPAGVSAQSIGSYEWDFGDGDTGTGETVTHTFADDGEYTVTLTVTNNDGTTAETSKSVMVGNPPPEASFTFSLSNPLTNETVTFDASNSGDPASVTAQNIVSYEWDFGDGNSATGETVAHSYSDNGDYEVTLTVTDDDGGTNSVSKTISVQNRAPQASFTADPTSGTAPLTVDFDASGSSDSDGSIQSYEWDFDDGNTGNGEAVTHTFANDGKYTVTLTVTDDDGATAQASKDVMVGQVSTDPAWPMVKQNPQRTNRSPFEGPQQANTKWIFRGNGLDCCAIGNGGTIYVGSSSGLYAITPSGNREWLNSSFEPVADPAVGPDGRIFVVASFPNKQKEDLVALDQQGNILWRFENINTFYPDTRVALGNQGTLYYFTDCWDTMDQEKHPSVIALSVLNGDIRWIYDVTENRTLSNGQCAASPQRSTAQGAAPPALDHQGNIYVGFKKQLISLSSTGTFRWKRSFANGPAGGISIANDGTLYVTYENSLFSIEPATPQQTNWQKKFPDNPLHGNSLAIGPNEQVHVDVDCQTISCVHNKMFTFDEQGNLLWKNDPVAGKKAVGSNGTVYGDSLTDIIAINSDGTQQWRTDSPCSNSGVAIGPDGTLYVGGSDALCAFER